MAIFLEDQDVKTWCSVQMESREFGQLEGNIQTEAA